MAETMIDIRASADQVYDQLLDVERYPEWLIGADRIRDVEADWPAVGSVFHHTIGFGPLKVRGTTTVRRNDRPNEFRLAAGMGPLGEAVVRFRLTDTGDTTRLEVTEIPSRGPARLSWRVAGPVVEALLWGRNAASLERLKAIVESTRPIPST